MKSLTLQRQTGNLQICAVAIALCALLIGCSSSQHTSDANQSYGTFNIDLTAAATPESVDEYDAFIKERAPAEDAFVAVQRMAEPAEWAKKWDRADSIYEKYRPLFPKMKDRFDKVEAVLNGKDEGLIVRNLGAGINSIMAEYSPVPTADGKHLYFVSDDRPQSPGGEDIFVSELHDSTWGKAQDIGGGVNTASHEFITSITADDNRIIFLGNYPEVSLGHGDLFFVDRTDTGWGAVQHFPAPVNSEYFECDGYLTSDGKALLFTSDRPKGIGDEHHKPELFHGDYWGNTDIYVSLRGADASWGTPINLGPTINTPFAERSPFLHPDGKTLYFSSAGHAGIGRLDVYKCTRLKEDSWTEWSEPVNVGKEINTPGDDWGYRIATSGDVGYFSTAGRPEGFGDDDIYSVTLPKKARPLAVATIHGVVTDPAGHPLDAEIKWDNLELRKNAGTLKSNPQDGKYFIVVPLGVNYGYYAEKKGYYPVSKNVDLRGITESTDRTENIVLVTIEEMKEKETAVRINNIFFEYDRALLKTESYPELDRVAVLLKANPETKVEISGHTDNLGTDAYNVDLSLKRAEAVVAYLITVGCKHGTLQARGYGKSKPVATNDTEEGRQLNRRVEFQFVK